MRVCDDDALRQFKEDYTEHAKSRAKRQRRSAQSRLKYKALVEAHTEPTAEAEQTIEAARVELAALIEEEAANARDA
eukprot:COSAG02_NODE_620_length_19443_cov_91.259564_3_plen_77_part_00